MGSRATSAFVKSSFLFSTHLPKPAQLFQMLIVSHYHIDNKTGCHRLHSVPRIQCTLVKLQSLPMSL